MKTTILVCFSLALLVVSNALPAQENTCTMCHSGHTAGAVHSATDTQCVACHGDGKTHIAEPSAGGIIAFDSETAKVRSAACTGCHATAHVSAGNVHEQAGVACNDCHTIHTAAESNSSAQQAPGLQRIGENTRVCIDCHDDVFAEFNYSERHRLQENSLSCTSCHDPHDADTGPRLGNTGDNRCSECHAAQSGPFVFEHQASRVDGCSACHTPHGSPNRHLLAHQRIGELCYSCHAEVPQFHLGFAPSGPARFGVDTGCTNCHATIHGSNIDRNFLQ